MRIVYLNPQVCEKSMQEYQGLSHRLTLVIKTKLGLNNTNKKLDLL
jgi:hypothetical protein